MKRFTFSTSSRALTCVRSPEATRRRLSTSGIGTATKPISMMFNPTQIYKTSEYSSFVYSSHKQINPQELTKRFGGNFVSFKDASCHTFGFNSFQSVNETNKNDHNNPLSSDSTLKKGYYQAPLSDVGRNVRDCDPHAIQVYSIPEFITEEQEVALIKYTNLLFDRIPFQQSHTDNLIYHYKEFYRSQHLLMNDDGFFGLKRDEIDSGEMSSEGSNGTMKKQSNYQRNAIIDEHLKGKLTEHEVALIRKALGDAAAITQTYMPRIPVQDRVHFLRLDGNGFIKGHADESSNSSGIVAGLTLGSGRVMTLSHPRLEKEWREAVAKAATNNNNNDSSSTAVSSESIPPPPKIHLLLAPRSLYMLTGNARYDWYHSVDWVRDDEGHLKRIRMRKEEEEGPPITTLRNHNSSTSANQSATELADATDAVTASKAVLVGGAGSEVAFDGKPTGMIRDTRTALIWRGIPPMELLMRNSSKMNAVKGKK